MQLCHIEQSNWSLFRDLNLKISGQSTSKHHTPTMPTVYWYYWTQRGRDGHYWSERRRKIWGNKSDIIFILGEPQHTSSAYTHMLELLHTHTHTHSGSMHETWSILGKWCYIRGWNREVCGQTWNQWNSTDWSCLLRSQCLSFHSLIVEVGDEFS